ncbi:Hypothetical protein GbCGDNIH1_8009 [Granulibacter bethesdensis CGDNIH1]|uniref:Uncharacterized protein n=1 Tax=Granulibacter bethesdensis (strain ATCC BAA-1260 / CGDNIH1) TaxID=391165 RepID=A0A286M2X1_GRABC|nr:Hypothetical protein GbCGDNIH5_8009 [Granulibacter bethesdensis]APH63930.1 Hypothetical protein GbCGDNIH1I4_8009 [Granulibacter bethesdensis]ASV62370.1 Hypothetical protein GbCGDNIH1_8009 [Granulibacter bethesdensis CGDNIH1]
MEYAPPGICRAERAGKLRLPDILSKTTRAASDHDPGWLKGESRRQSPRVEDGSVIG